MFNPLYFFRVWEFWGKRYIPVVFHPFFGAHGRLGVTRVPTLMTVMTRTSGNTSHWLTRGWSGHMRILKYAICIACVFHVFICELLWFVSFLQARASVHWKPPIKTSCYMQWIQCICRKICVFAHSKVGQFSNSSEQHAMDLTLTATRLPVACLSAIPEVLHVCWQWRGISTIDGQNTAPFRMAKTLLLLRCLTYQLWPGPGCFRAPRTQDVRHCEGMVCFRDLIWQAQFHVEVVQVISHHQKYSRYYIFWIPSRLNGAPQFYRSPQGLRISGNTNASGQWLYHQHHHNHDDDDHHQQQQQQQQHLDQIPCIIASNIVAVVMLSTIRSLMPFIHVFHSIHIFHACLWWMPFMPLIHGFIH